MKKLIKSATVACLLAIGAATLVPGSASAWGWGPGWGPWDDGGWGNGWGNAGLNFSIGASGWGNGWGNNGWGPWGYPGYWGGYPGWGGGYPGWGYPGYGWGPYGYAPVAPEAPKSTAQSSK